MKSFIPKLYKKEPVTIRLDKDKLERIDTLSSETGLSRSVLIGQCIAYALDNLEIEATELRMAETAKKG